MHWLIFLVLLPVCSVATAADIKAVRLWHEDARARVVFDLSASTRYKLFTMQNPHRLVIDFKHSRAPRPLRLQPGAASVVRGLRHAPRGAGDLRVVLDLHARCVVAGEAVPPAPGYGHRLVLDLVPAAGAPVPAPVAVAAVSAQAPQATPPQPRPPAPAPLQQARDIVVAIDAGHGGADVGAIGPSGVYEKDITLAVARELAAHINGHPGMRAVLTRDGDRYLKLRERMDRARSHRADLFVSVHADAFRDRRVKGSSVYVLSQRGASSEAAKWLAEKENAADLIGGVSLDDKDDVLKSVLLDLSQTASLDASIDLANAVLNGLKRIGPVHRKDVQHAGFMVLKSPDIPSILVETAFISNPTEEKRLRSAAYRRQLAGAIFDGILGYSALNPPPGTQVALRRRHRVARGDTLSEIADRYDVSVDSIMLANNLPSKLVRAGAVLRIP